MMIIGSKRTPQDARATNRPAVNAEEGGHHSPFSRSSQYGAVQLPKNIYRVLISELETDEDNRK